MEVKLTEPKIIFEDDYFFVLDKPPGWIVNEADTTKDREVLQIWIAQNLKSQISGNKSLRSGIVHRLDKDTSGVILIAKTEEVFRELQNQFKTRVVNKEYVALVHGKVCLEKGNINTPVGRLPWNRERFGIVPGGKEADTDYEIISYYEGKDGNEKYTLLRLKPKTGRTHQIRVHLKYIGNSIVSDDFYAGRKTSRKDKLLCKRLFLHAKTISFIHPDTKNPVFFESKLPDDLTACLSNLKTVQ